MNAKLTRRVPRRGAISVLIALATAGAICAMAPVRAQSMPDATLSQPSTYNFEWRLVGSAAVLPYQIFDDGQRTYLQFGSDAVVPAIFVQGPGGSQLAHPHFEAPYLVVDAPAAVLEFRVGNQVGRAIRGRHGEAPGGVATGAAVPVRVTGAASVPVPRETLATSGQTDIASGITATVPEVANAPAPTSWSLTTADQDVAVAVKRWAKEAGWSLVWDSSIPMPITGDSTVHGSFAEALSNVVEALRQAGYPLALAAPDNIKRTARVYQTTPAGASTETSHAAR